MNAYAELVRAIGHGFHPDTKGEDYTSLPEGYTPERVDAIVDAHMAEGFDAYADANEILSAYPAGGPGPRSVLVSVELDGYGLASEEITRLVREALTTYVGATMVNATEVTPAVLRHMGNALWVGLGNEDYVGDAALEATVSVFPVAGT